MKRNFFQKPLLTLIAIFIICFSSIFIINGCRKFDHNYERMHRDYTQMFFQVPGNTLPIVKKVADYIKHQNDKDGFINEFVKRHGIPRWDKARVIADRGSNSRTTVAHDSIVLIPTIQVDSNIVHSFLACLIQGSNVKIKVFDGAAYKAYPNNNRLDTISSSFVTLTCIILNYVVSGRVWYFIKDSTILDTPHHVHPLNGIRFLRLMPQNPLALVEPISFTFCADIWVPNNGQVVGATPGGPDPNVQGSYQTVCTSYTFWATVIDDDPIYSGPPPSGGGGGGGGNWYDPANQPCRAMPGDYPCGSGASLPFAPIVDDMGQYNPYQADTIGYSDALRDIYHCTYAFIHDSLPNVNFIAQISGANLFKDSAYMHLTFDTSTTYTTPGVSGQTISSSISIDNYGFTHFHAIIKLNGWYLRNATKEYMVSTIVHEVMHAIFTLRWGQYHIWLTNHTGTIDSFFMKEHFPIYWNDYVINGVPPNQINDHQIMATDYNSFFSSLVRPFYNPAAPTAIRDTVLKAMGYGGLHESTAWGLLPSQGIDTCKYKNLNATAAKALIGTFSIDACAPFTTHYADSLKLSHSCN